jgi:hypothetical protein
MSKTKATDFEEFEATLLQDPEILKEYLDLKPKYDLVRELIESKHKFHPDK